MKVVPPLLTAMGNTHYPESQRQAALTLKVCVGGIGGGNSCECVCVGGGDFVFVRLKTLPTSSRFCWAVTKV